MPKLARVVVFLLAAASPGVARAQPNPAANAADGPPAWSARVSMATYFLPDEDDYVQPTGAADHGWLHLETRYNYEGRDSLSGFIGWNLDFGGAVTVRLTPMFGGVTGDTDGIIPALEAGLTWRWLDLYTEGEYVFDVNQKQDRFLYNWFEGSVWLRDWLRLGLVTQRTRAYQSDREIQRGVLAGAAIARFEPTIYFFNPGADDYLIVATIGIELMGEDR